MSGLSSTRNPERRGGSEVGVTRPLPLLKPETKFFWTAGRDGELRFQRCGGAAPFCTLPAQSVRTVAHVTSALPRSRAEASFAGSRSTIIPGWRASRLPTWWRSSLLTKTHASV